MNRSTIYCLYFKIMMCGRVTAHFKAKISNLTNRCVAPNKALAVNI